MIKPSSQTGVFHRITSWVEYSQLHVGLVAATLSAATFILAGLDVELNVVLVCVFGAVLVYIVDRIDPDESDLQNHPVRSDWFKKNRRPLLLIVGLLIVSILYICSQLEPRRIIVATILAIGGIGYSLPPRIFRRVALAKPFVIALVWSVGIVLLPLAGSGLGFGEIVLLAGYRFAYLVPNTVLSDVPDLHGDGATGNQTPASMLSQKPMIGIVLGSIVSAVVLGSALVGSGFSFLIVLIDLAGMLLFLPFLVVKSITPRMKFLLDTALLWPLVLFLVG